MIFQPTLPARGATRGNNLSCVQIAISTHAPRTGSDILGTHTNQCFSNFNPRSPHGERRTPRRADPCGWSNFNPRSPHGERRTSPCASATGSRHFNPRSPHGERRASYFPRIAFARYFNPRSPHGERQAEYLSAIAQRSISTHAPRTGSDGGLAGRPGVAGISTHAPRTGSDPTT